MKEATGTSPVDQGQVARGGQALGVQPSGNQTTLAAPSIVSRKVTLTSGERAKYQLLGEQSQYLAKHEAAGASDATKITLIVVGGIVIAAAIMASTDHGIITPHLSLH